ncbi:uncharacterized protein N7482_004902 [Penicillium canariense]|uniref:Uncharacterized protein n=1 Tax=Penicillium canariense TaxID=189055 RepID=A0A9W9LMI0_9EURO|nr:uncharacterized protein N7482_004902 [Penicillium canariense]KAJ5166121.1 hypothetical protein N7482_004902 [Penicillium canariense]
MRTIRDFFRRPSLSRVNQDFPPDLAQSDSHGAHEPPTSSPLSEPPRSSITIDLTQDGDDGEDGPDTQLSKPSLRSASDSRPESFALEAFAPDQSYLRADTESIGPPSSLSGSFNASQRIVKDGKEVVISSDGEDTDSVASLEDPDALFAPKTKPKPKNAGGPAAKAYQPDKALLAKLSAPKKYKHTIESLVHDAVDDNEMEANVAKARAAFVQSQQNGDQSGMGGSKKGLNEGMLVSAFGDDGDEGPSLRRLMEAVRRTEALEQDRAWRFFDQSQMTPATPDFLIELFPASSPLAGLREPNSRVRVFQSGVLEYAASLQRLPDEFLVWLFRSVPLEPREELRKAYCRIFTQAPKAQVESLIHPDDIDCLFRQLGAKSQAMNLSELIVADSPERSSNVPHLKDRMMLISVLTLIGDTAAANLFSDKTQEHAVHILLRMALDTSLTADDVIRSELQGTLTSLLEFGPKERMESGICTTVYQTVKDPQFQSRLLQNILPTSTWVSLLRYRLAVAFLLQDPGPLTEPPEVVLGLTRITLLLMRDERFHLKKHKGINEYDYGDLIAITLLLDICINSALYDLGYRQGDTEEQFNISIDRLASQIKRIFSSIEDTGASHLQRMLAKQALEALHYRMVYSVRSKAPPKRTLFKTFGREKNGDIKSIFKANFLGGASAIDTGLSTPSGSSDADSVEGTAMPIRGDSRLS